MIGDVLTSWVLVTGRAAVELQSPRVETTEITLADIDLGVPQLVAVDVEEAADNQQGPETRLPGEV